MAAATPAGWEVRVDRSFGRWYTGAAVVLALVVVIPAGLAWACVGVVSLTTSSSTVQAGGTVTVTGREFAAGSPVEIHLDSPTGPVLATSPASKGDTMTSKFTLPVTVPAGVPSGQHVLVASQQYHDMNAGAPARAVLYVGTSPPAPAAPAARPANVIIDKGRSPAGLALLGLAVAVGALVIAGLVTATASRRRPTARTGQPS